LVTRLLASSEQVWESMASSSVDFCRKTRTVHCSACWGGAAELPILLTDSRVGIHPGQLKPSIACVGALVSIGARAVSTDGPIVRSSQRRACDCHTRFEPPTFAFDHCAWVPVPISHAVVCLWCGEGGGGEVQFPSAMQ
jgi:hypothetical protein